MRVAWRNNPLPFHQNAMPAAEAASEAFAQGGSAKFWAMHDKMFGNQQALTRPDLDKYAQEVGLDMNKFKAALDNHTHQTKIKADQDLGQKMGAGGTPAFFINGRFLSGAQPLPRFKEVIDDEIKRTDKLIASGVTKKQGLCRADQERPDWRQGCTRRWRSAEAAPARPEGGLQGAGRQGAAEGPVRRADHDRRVQRLPVPVLQPREPTIKQITDTYGKDVRVIWRNNPLPFHDKAALAAEAAMEAADEGKFWEYHDKMFANQQALAREDLEKYARSST